jgi:hypothetical protein
MPNLRLILLVFALVLFVLAALPPTSAHWQRLVAAGFACAVAALLFG